eukprot:Skav218178  [mRNA]  locus=scaffold5213:186012:187187:- [translate_table: standard]
MGISRIPVNSICQNAAITACSAAMQWTDSVHLFLNFCTPTVVSYTALMAAHNAELQWQMAFFLLSDLRCSGLRADALCTAAAADASWELALKLFTECNEISYKVTEICSRYGKWEYALSLLDEMLRTFAEPSASTFASVMNACGSSNQWKVSLHLLVEMLSISIEATAASCSAVINACSWSGRWEWALQLFFNFESRSVEFDAISFSAVASGLERGSQWQLTSELFSHVKEVRLEADTAMYNCILSTLQEGSRWPSALANIEQMRACALQMDDITCNVAINSINSISASEALGWATAIRLAGEMRLCSMQQDEVTYNTVIACFDQWPLALNAATQMSSRMLSPSSVTLATLGWLLQERAKWRLAIQQLQRTPALPNALTFPFRCPGFLLGF